MKAPKKTSLSLIYFSAYTLIFIRSIESVFSTMFLLVIL